MVPSTSASMKKDESATSVRVEIEKVARPTVQARQAIGVFDSGSGGMVAAAHLSRILGDAKAPCLQFCTLSHAIGHELPLVPYAFAEGGIAPQLAAGVIDYERTPHVAVLREDEPGPGGTTRAGIRHWEPPQDLPHGVEIVARDAPLALRGRSLAGCLMPLHEHPVRPIAGENRSYFAFSRERTPEETFKSLRLEQIVLAEHL